MNILIILGFLAAALTVVLTMLSWRFTAAVAAAGLLSVYIAGAPGEVSLLIFWMVAAALVIVLNLMLPLPISVNRRGLGYIGVGTLAGLLTGYLISPSWLVLGSVLGALAGGMAYALTPAGRILRFPSAGFLNYLCAKGLPAVVNLTIAALTVIGGINAWR